MLLRYSLILSKRPNIFNYSSFWQRFLNSRQSLKSVVKYYMTPKWTWNASIEMTMGYG
ncbi:hypothetical protein ABIB62_003668 [Mucilaginibacter sp. UYP25]